MNESIREKAIQLRHKLHQYPELSMQEHYTKELLMDFLRENTSLRIVDRGRWFYAVYDRGEGEKNIAFRADFDAVPVGEDKELVPYYSRNEGVGHKCGHDGHSAALAAFGMMLDQFGARQNVYLLFQHAEETGQGAAECLTFLEENHIDEIYAVHNMPGLREQSVAVSSGVVQYASTGMTLEFHGQKSHACYPEDGINPAYGISELVLALEPLRREQNYKGLTMITIIGIEVGEEAFGTSAGDGRLLLTVRGEHEEELKDLLRRIEVLAASKASEYQMQWSVTYEDEFADCFNHESAAAKVRRAAKASGIPVENLKEPFRASEDFGRFTKAVPGAIFYVGDGENYPALHTPQFDFPDENLEVIVRMYMAILAEDEGAQGELSEI